MRVAPSADEHPCHLDVKVQNCNPYPNFNLSPNSDPNLSPNPNLDHNPNVQTTHPARMISCMSDCSDDYQIIRA